MEICRKFERKSSISRIKSCGNLEKLFFSFLSSSIFSHSLGSKIQNIAPRNYFMQPILI